MHKRIRGRVRQLGPIERNILEELSVGDLLYGFLLSGRSTRLMYKLAHERATHRHRRKLAIQRLLGSDHIQVTGELLSITQVGQSALGGAIAKNRELLQTKKWDRKWRVAAFDIPEIYAPLRNKVRRVLKEAGFVQLQQSIWVFPHDCEKLVQLIKNESRLSKYILYGVLDQIEDDERLKKLFRL